MFKLVGDRLATAIIKMDIPIDDLPWVSGRLDVYKFLELYLKGLRTKR